MISTASSEQIREASKSVAADSTAVTSTTLTTNGANAHGKAV